MYLATTFSLLLLCDGDGTIFPITKVLNSNGGKLEIMTMGCGNNNSDDVTMIVCNVGGDKSRLCLAQMASYSSPNMEYFNF